MNKNPYEEHILPYFVGMEIVKDQIRGCIYGQILGDMFGSHFNLKKGEEVLKMLDDPESPVPFPAKSWSGITDLMLLQIDLLIETAHMESSKVNQLKIKKGYVEKLVEWKENGWPEIKRESTNVDKPIDVLLSQKNFRMMSDSIVQSVWLDRKVHYMSNSCIARGSLFGALQNISARDIKRNAEDILEITHFEDFSISSGIAAALFIHYILLGEYLVESIIKKVSKISGDIIGDNEHRIRFCDYFTRNPNETKMDSVKTAEDPLKTICIMASAFRTHNSRTADFKEIMMDVASFGGATKSNCAAVGAIMGAYIGYEELPLDWIVSIPHKEWLEQKIEKFVEACTAHMR